MADLFDATFGQIPQLTQTLTVSMPDILGNVTISGTNGTIGTLTQGVFGTENLSIGGEHVATFQDSVVGNYDIVTNEGTFTAMDNVYGGDSLLHFGETVTYSRPGLFGSENWYDAGTNELLASTGMDGLGQATITLPSVDSFDAISGFDSFAYSSDLVDMNDLLTSSTDFIDFLDFI